MDNGTPIKKSPSLYYVDNAVELVAPEGRHFFSITALDGGNVTVKGGESLSKSCCGDGDDNPNFGIHKSRNGKAFVAADNPFGAGHYEALPLLLCRLH